MYTTYFVKDKLLNGEEGVYATTCGFGIQQKDGWYFLPNDADDGIGPYPSKEAAEVAAAEHVAQTKSVDEEA